MASATTHMCMACAITLPMEDGHDKCIACLGFQHAEATRDNPAACMNCFIMPWRTREARAHFFAGKRPHFHSNNDRAAKCQVKGRRPAQELRPAQGPKSGQQSPSSKRCCIELQQPWISCCQRTHTSLPPTSRRGRHRGQRGRGCPSCQTLRPMFWRSSVRLREPAAGPVLAAGWQMLAKWGVSVVNAPCQTTSPWLPSCHQQGQL